MVLALRVLAERLENGETIDGPSEIRFGLIWAAGMRAKWAQKTSGA
jgi:hypothetical protein